MCEWNGMGGGEERELWAGLAGTWGRGEHMHAKCARNCNGAGIKLQAMPAGLVAAIVPAAATITAVVAAAVPIAPATTAIIAAAPPPPSTTVVAAAAIVPTALASPGVIAAAPPPPSTTVAASAAVPVSPPAGTLVCRQLDHDNARDRDAHARSLRWACQACSESPAPPRDR